MDSEELPEKFADLNAQEFPFILYAANNERHQIDSWETLNEFIETRPRGCSELAYLRRYRIEGDNRPLAFGSMLSPLIAPYLFMYFKATAKYQHGHLFAGDAQDQPNVLMEAFAMIEGQFNKQEQNRIRLARRQQKEAALRNG